MTRYILAAATAAMAQASGHAADIGSPVPLEARVTSLEQRVARLEALQAKAIPTAGPAKADNCPCGAFGTCPDANCPAFGGSGPCVCVAGSAQKAAGPIVNPNWTPSAAIPVGFARIDTGPQAGQLVRLDSEPVQQVTVQSFPVRAVRSSRGVVRGMFGNQTCVGGNCGN